MDCKGIKELFLGHKIAAVVKERPYNWDVVCNPSEKWAKYPVVYPYNKPEACAFQIAFNALG
jgi:hypothetical protein